MIPYSTISILNMHALYNPSLQSTCTDLSHQDRICIQRQLMPGTVFISKEHSKLSANGKRKKKKKEEEQRGKEGANPQVQVTPFASQRALQYIPSTARSSICNKDT